MDFRFLTKDFFTEYNDCNEMEKKENRPYATVLLVKYLNLNFAIPMRSHINHNYAIFTDKDKSKGLDLSKAVVINNSELYIDYDRTAYINSDEYKKLLGKEYFIVKKLENYIKLYKKSLSKKDVLKNKILCERSCLQYFHKELGIKE